VSMKIYTKTGDDGQTMRPGGEIVSKADPFAEAVGTVDELNAQIGLCLAAAGTCPDIAEALAPIQPQLLGVGSLIAAAGTDALPYAGVLERDVEMLEETIDRFWAKLPPLERFILPGGCELAARLHVARTVARRAERRTVGLIDAGTPVKGTVLKYLNRLSDLLFALARLANLQDGHGDHEWNWGG
jgi:cob(I)alamin adenosyltransferase